LPADANYYELRKHRHQSGNGEHINRALHTIENSNSRVKSSLIFSRIYT
jgi:hypothetical protein